MSEHGFNGFPQLNGGFAPRNGGGGGGLLPSLIPELIGIIPGIIPQIGGSTGQPQFPQLPTLPFQPRNGNGNGFVGPTRCGPKAMAPTQANNGQLCCPTGWHLSEKKDRCTGAVTVCCVRNRRMNPCNARAISRACRRLAAFDRVEKRIRKAMRRAGAGRPARRRAPRAPAKAATCPTCP